MRLHLPDPEISSQQQAEKIIRNRTTRARQQLRWGHSYLGSQQPPSSTTGPAPRPTHAEIRLKMSLLACFPTGQSRPWRVCLTRHIRKMVAIKYFAYICSRCGNAIPFPFPSMHKRVRVGARFSFTQPRHSSTSGRTSSSDRRHRWDTRNGT